jgi:hypothetical protein
MLGVGAVHLPNKTARVWREEEDAHSAAVLHFKHLPRACKTIQRIVVYFKGYQWALLITKNLHYNLWNGTLRSMGK